MTGSDIVGGESVPSSIVGGDDGDDVPVPARIARQPRRGRTEGPLRAIIVVVCAGGLWDGAFSDPPPAGWPAPVGMQALVVGAVLAPWVLSGPESATHSTETLRQLAVRRCHARDVFGYIEYPITEILTFKTPFLVETVEAARAGLHNADAGTSVWATKPGQSEPPSETDLGTILGRWKSMGIAIGPSVLTLGLALAMAARILRGVMPCLHVVPVTRRVDRKRLISPKEPSRRCLSNFLREAQRREQPTSAPAAQVATVSRLPGWSRFLSDPDLVLDWLHASSFVKQVQESARATHAFARIFARSSGRTRAELTSNLVKFSCESLRSARARLDLAAMLVWRRLWVALLASGAPVHLYIYCDASPQKGTELFAASVDVYDGKCFRRWLLPCVALDPQLLDSVGKAFALVWQIFLLTGPTFHLVRAFLQRVVSITTDMGVERLIADKPYFLDIFYDALKPGFHPGPQPEERWMWPNAVVVPGWKHAWDLILQKGLCDLRWFPGWLAKLKAISSFFRIEGNRVATARSMRTKGMEGLADIVQNMRLPRFADWRWGTLHECMQSLMGFLDSLANNFDPTPFANGRDKAGLTAVVEAFQSRVWRLQAAFVAFFSAFITRLMNWGSGCECHEAALLRGAEVECGFKGRRLPRAQGHLMAELDGLLQESAAWSEERWGLGHQGLLELQGVIRATHLRGRRKFAWMGRLPYLLCRLDQPGVRDQCLQQWEATEEQHHHRVSIAFLKEGSAMRRDIDDMPANGMSESLQAAVQGLGAVPLDDSVSEGPHAKAHRIARHSHRASWPWLASTMRIDQNLIDAREVAASVDADFKKLWCGVSSIVRVDGRYDLQNSRMPKQRLLDYVYRMSFLFETRPDGGGGGGGGQDSEGDSGGDDDDDGNEGPKAGPLEQASPEGGAPKLRKRRDGGAPSRLDQVGEKYHHRDKAVGPPPKAQSSEVVKLLRQYLLASLEVHSVISVREPLEDGGFATRWFQILTMEMKGLYIKTCRSGKDDDDEAEENGLFAVSVQPFCRWMGPGAEEAGEPKDADCFVYQEPCMVDILGLCGAVADSRGGWRSWSTRASDVDGCLNMHSAVPLRTNKRLNAPNVPVLALLDALEADDWHKVERKVHHKKGSKKEFDGRYLLRSRAYFQCLLALGDLLAAGVPGFESGLTAGFYKVLLKTKKLPAKGLKALEYKRLLAEQDGDRLQLALLDRSAPEPLAIGALEAPAPPGPLEDVVGGARERSASEDESPRGSIVGGEEDEEAMAPEPAPGGQPGQPGAVALIDGVPAEILGQRVIRIQGRCDLQWSYNARIAVRCRNPAHTKCIKTRSRALGRDQYGPRAAEYFLGAWLLRSDLSEAEHKAYVPSPADIAAYAASL